MKRNKYEKNIPFMVFVLMIMSTLVITLLLSTKMSGDVEEKEEAPNVLDQYEEVAPVINETNYITNPFTDPNVTIGKTYYDYQGEEASQENSIIVQDNTYYQNTGIDYVKEEQFDIVSVAEGIVNEVKEDELVGKVIEIEHKNGLISIYQSLSEVSVKKGDSVNQGQIIGKSGTNEMDKELGNHLHFEIYNNGQNVDPILYLNKEYKKEN